MDKRQPLETFNINKSFAPMIEMGFFKQHKLVPFEYENTEFSAVNAWWMADFSRLAYVRDVKLVLKKLGTAKFTKVKFFEDIDTGTQAFVACSKDAVVLVFRGTEVTADFQDIVIDADFWMVDSVAGKVHRGFQKSLDSIWKDIELHLQYVVKDHKVWFTGHSLGAALATLAAARYTPTVVYTFGSPRVGNRTFAASIKCPIHRIAKSNDIVTRVPPPIFYHQIGNVHFVTNEGKILHNPGMLTRFKERLGGSELKILWLLIKMIFFRSPWSFLLSYLHDHSPYNYSVFMWNNIDKQ